MKSKDKSTKFTVVHWICKKCRTHNHVTRKVCLECGRKKPDGVDSRPMHKGGGFTAGEN